MSKRRQRTKKSALKEHRKLWYYLAMQKVIDGKAEPAYATERFNKLREVS